MLENFLDKFGLTGKFPETGDFYHNFLGDLGGWQFAQKIFSTFTLENTQEWTQLIKDAFPGFDVEFSLFAYDWKGSCYGVRHDDDTVLLFELCDGNVYEIPVPMLEFLDDMLPKQAEDILRIPDYRAWLRKHHDGEPGPYQCISHRVPLFLGGEDTVDNMELSDLNVVWSLYPQLWQAADGAEDGTVFGDFTIE